MRRLAALSFATAGLLLASMPVNAADPDQAGGSERVNTVIVYGSDPCPVSQGDEITVCARKAEEERYRIPAPLRETPSAKSEAWNERVLAYETVGATGTNSCSAVGPGGSSGCMQKLINNAYAERRGASDVQFSKMIDEERQKRLSTIDQDAAATQARVEQAEKAYDARQRAQQDPDGASSPAPTPAPTATATP